MPFTEKLLCEPCPCSDLFWKKLNCCGEDVLLQALGAGLSVDQGLKDGEHVTAVFDQAREDIAKGRLAFGLAMPFEEHRLRNFNIAAEFFGRVPAQEQAVKEGRLPLREVEIVQRFLSHVGCGWDGRVCVSLHLHLETEKAVYPKFCRRQVLLHSGCHFCNRGAWVFRTAWFDAGGGSKHSCATSRTRISPSAMSTIKI
jgi:hypothetical protein